METNDPNRFYFSVKTGRWGGVVTAFITMSNVKDEIDWEFPGAAVTEGQTNFFWQGYIRTFTLRCVSIYFLSLTISLATAGTNGATEKGLTDTFANYHDYTVSSSNLHWGWVFTLSSSD
jgi:beta-glucanase (GH16 family)